MLFLGLDSGAIEVWDLEKTIQEHTIQGSHNSAVYALQMVGDKLASACEHRLCLWCTTSWGSLRNFELRLWIRGQLSSGVPFLAVCGGMLALGLNDAICLWAPESSGPPRVIALAPDDEISALTAHGNTLVCSTLSGIVRILDRTRDWKHQRVRDIGECVSSLLVSRSGTKLFVALDHGAYSSIEVLECSDGKWEAVRRLNCGSEHNYILCMIHCGGSLVSVSEMTSIKVWV